MLGLTSVAAGLVGTMLALPPRSTLHAPRSTLPEEDLSLAALVLFILFLVSTAWYWKDALDTLGLATILAKPGRLKEAEQSGTINLSSLKYLFRSSIIAPVVLTMAVYRHPQS